MFLRAPSRRTAAIFAVLTAFVPTRAALAQANAVGRPSVEARKFRSEAVEKVIAEVKAAAGNPALGKMFENCFPNTLDTTVTFAVNDGVPDTYVITGDIDAMWLRDSSAQVDLTCRFARTMRRWRR